MRPTVMPTVVHVVLTRQERDRREVLLLRRPNTGRGDGTWGPPAGRVEAGEATCEAGVREVREELGLDLDPAALTAVEEHVARDDHRHAFFVATQWTGEPRNAEPHRADAVAWFEVEDLPAPIVEHVRAGLLRALRRLREPARHQRSLGPAELRGTLAPSHEGEQPVPTPSKKKPAASQPATPHDLVSAFDLYAARIPTLGSRVPAIVAETVEPLAVLAEVEGARALLRYTVSQPWEDARAHAFLAVGLARASMGDAGRREVETGEATLRSDPMEDHHAASAWSAVGTGWHALGDEASRDRALDAAVQAAERASENMNPWDGYARALSATGAIERLPALIERTRSLSTSPRFDEALVRGISLAGTRDDLGLLQSVLALLPESRAHSVSQGLEGAAVALHTQRRVDALGRLLATWRDPSRYWVEWTLRASLRAAEAGEVAFARSLVHPLRDLGVARPARIAEALAACGDDEEARALLAADESVPWETKMGYYRACTAVRLGDLARALDEAKRFPRDELGPWLREMLPIAQRRGDLDTLRDGGLALLVPPNGGTAGASGVCQVGLALRALGRADEADGLFERAIQQADTMPKGYDRDASLSAISQDLAGVDACEHALTARSKVSKKLQIDLARHIAYGHARRGDLRAALALVAKIEPDEWALRTVSDLIHLRAGDRPPFATTSG